MRNFVFYLIVFFVSCSSDTNNTSKMDISKNYSKMICKAEYTINLDSVSKKNGLPYLRLTSLFSNNTDRIYIGTDVNTILAFDSNGSYISNMGRTGNGPGEMINGGDGVCFNDTVMIFDNKLRRIAKWNKELNFIEFTNYTDEIRFMQTNGEHLLFNNWSYQLDDNKVDIVENVYIKHKDSTKSILIKSSSIPQKKSTNLGNRISIEIDLEKVEQHRVGENAIISAVKSTNDYILNVFNLSGYKNLVVKRDFHKIGFSKNEKIEYVNLYDKQYKNSFNNFYIDKDNNLLVQVNTLRDSVKSGFFFDVFKDFKFSGRVKMDFIKCENEEYANLYLIFDFGKLFIYSRDKNIVTAFNYFIE